MTDKEILDTLERRVGDDLRYFTHVSSYCKLPELYGKCAYAREVFDMVRNMRNAEYGEDGDETPDMEDIWDMGERWNDAGESMSPCPFCGGIPMVVESWNEDAETMYKVCCRNGGCAVRPSTEMYASARDAVEAWNGSKGKRRYALDVENIMKGVEILKERLIKDEKRGN